MYKEFIVLGGDTWNMTFVDNCMHATIISSNRCWVDGFGTLPFSAGAFMACDLYIENTTNNQPEDGVGASDGTLIGPQINPCCTTTPYAVFRTRSMPSPRGNSIASAESLEQ